MKVPQNKMKLVLSSHSVNEGFARYAVSAFIAQLDPTIEEITDIRTVISEAVTNAIIHGYRDDEGDVYISVVYYDDKTVRIKIRDRGCGIDNIEQAMQPFYSSDSSGERGGMGFTIMNSFTDALKVTSKLGAGTVVTMTKKLK